VNANTTQPSIAHVTDRWYDAITIRVWGTGKDFVIKTATGDHVRGSKTHDRAYSEYWTLIRSAQRKGAPKPEAACGNCGAAACGVTRGCSRGIARLED
jgi:predicted lipid-binding transport protein (Tim44 family)